MDMITKIFDNEPLDPFSINLQILAPKTKNDNAFIFSRLKDILIKGLIMLTTGDQNNFDIKSLNIGKITENHIEKMKKYMLSFGINLHFLIVDKNEKDSLMRHFLYELEQIPDLSISVTMDWKSQLIEKLDFKMSAKNKNNVTKQIDVVIQNHRVINFFLKMYKPKTLKDYSIMVKNVKKQEHFIFFFSFATLSEHQKIHKCMVDHIKR